MALLVLSTCQKSFRLTASQGPWLDWKLPFASYIDEMTIQRLHVSRWIHSLDELSLVLREDIQYSRIRALHASYWSDSHSLPRGGCLIGDFSSLSRRRSTQSMVLPQCIHSLHGILFSARNRLSLDTHSLCAYLRRKANSFLLCWQLPPLNMQRDP